MAVSAGELWVCDVSEYELFLRVANFAGAEVQILENVAITKANQPGRDHMNVSALRSAGRRDQ
jgi:hypothetical protein